jgi:hypothetical protein
LLILFIIKKCAALEPRTKNAKLQIAATQLFQRYTKAYGNRASIFTEIKTLALVYLKIIKIEIIMSQNNYTTRIIILQGVFQK